MKHILFFICLTLEIISFIGLYLTRKVDSIRFWPPPTGRSWQSLLSRSVFTILMLLALVVGWLDYGTLQWPIPYEIPIGIFLILIGTFFVIGGIMDLGIKDFAGTGHRLKTDGIYGYSRNPQYLGHIIATAGWILVFQSVLQFLLGLGIILCFLYIPLVEEDYLMEEFGDEYRKYLDEVPRFIGIEPQD